MLLYTVEGYGRTKEGFLHDISFAMALEKRRKFADRVERIGRGNVENHEMSRWEVSFLTGKWDIWRKLEEKKLRSSLELELVEHLDEKVVTILSSGKWVLTKWYCFDHVFIRYEAFFILRRCRLEYLKCPICKSFSDMTYLYIYIYKYICTHT